jgi:hypothetical protein
MDNQANFFLGMNLQWAGSRERNLASGRGGAFFLTSLFIELIEVDEGHTINIDQFRVLGCGTIVAGVCEGWIMTLIIVAVIFGVFAIGLIVLLIYKSTLTMHRDDQLFLDDASSHMHAEQTELLAKVNWLIIPTRVFSVGSGVFLMVLTAMWLYQKLSAVQ